MDEKSISPPPILSTFHNPECDDQLYLRLDWELQGIRLEVSAESGEVKRKKITGTPLRGEIAQSSPGPQRPYSSTVHPAGVWQIYKQSPSSGCQIAECKMTNFIHN